MSLTNTASVHNGVQAAVCTAETAGAPTEVAPAQPQSPEVWKTIQADVPHQLHLCGTAHSGKTTLAAALRESLHARGVVTGPSDLSESLRGQILKILRGVGASPTPPFGGFQQTALVRQAESLRFRCAGMPALLLSFPGDPIGGPDSRETIERYVANPGHMLTPVCWSPRCSSTAARNVFFGLSGQLQVHNPDADARAVLAAGFGLSFNETTGDAISSYGADGLSELLADDRLEVHPVRVSSRRGPLARLTFEGLGPKSRAYEEILVDLTAKVVKVADVNGHDAYREVLAAIPEPLAFFSGWDLVIQSDALFRQPALADELYYKFMGTRVERTDRNFFIHGNLRGRIKVGSDLGRVHVHDLVTDGSDSLLRVFEDRVVRTRRVAAAAAVPQPSPQQRARSLVEVPISAREEDACLRGDVPREAIFRGLSLMPLVFAAGLIFAIAGTSAGAWWLWMIGATLAAFTAGFIWAQIRASHFRGGWACRSDRIIHLRQPIDRKVDARPLELRLVTSPLERRLDTARCYIGTADVRSWRIFRLARFEDATGLKAVSRWQASLPLWSIVGLALLALVRFFL
jgi:hypothetical protein